MAAEILRIVLYPLIAGLCFVPSAACFKELGANCEGYFAKRGLLSYILRESIEMLFAIFAITFAIALFFVPILFIRWGMDPGSPVSQNAKTYFLCGFLAGAVAGVGPMLWRDRGTNKLVRHLARLQGSTPALIEIWETYRGGGGKDGKVFSRVLRSKEINRLRWMFGEPFEIGSRERAQYRAIFGGQEMTFPFVAFMHKDGSFYEESGKSIFAGDDILLPGRYENLLRRVLERSGVEVPS